MAGRTSAKIVRLVTSCLTLGMTDVITSSNSRQIRIVFFRWQFSSSRPKFLSCHIFYNQPKTLRCLLKPKDSLIASILRPRPMLIEDSLLVIWALQLYWILPRIGLEFFVFPVLLDIGCASDVGIHVALSCRDINPTILGFQRAGSAQPWW